ncbi:hypothetical protein [Pontibacter akesuensis]|uniref:Uncharacterized protein n=1 Tax=Pontibacter akesuensis TaxID=388950 RepID=A0A1I7K4S8_9BACT|nr:hypothetical protein [Pontibacter akesuensis]GHA75099.1 hypothetical protein GCM10007389_31170 [Pontibacter akesuensis]SFU92390.1 hypothetical protein SAMN04487941_3388 [Pontibacter akesuensis]
MKQQALDNLLYLIGFLLVVSGVVVRVLNLSEHHLGLYLILGGLTLGLAIILHHMRQSCEREQEEKHKQTRHLEKH